MKRILALLTIAVLLLLCPMAVAAEGDGMTFIQEGHYFAKELPTTLPATFEATVKFPVGAEFEYSNTIFGSYITSRSGGMLFSVSGKGNPLVSFSNDEDEYHTATFESVNVFTGEWVHLAITWDRATHTLTCYVNGQVAGTLTEEFPDNVELSYALGLGTDHRTANRYRFKGSLKNAALYSDIRTLQEIAADVSGTFDQDNLLLGYDLSAGGQPEIIKDQSANQNDMVFESFWITDKEPVEDYAYSFAVLGDPQWMTKDYRDKLDTTFQWIQDNVEEKKMQHLFMVGDLTHTNTDEEWTVITDHINALDGKLPYTVVRGNHDNKGNFRQAFSYYEHNREQTHQAHNGTMLNSYQCFEVNGIPYMSMALDYSVTDEALEWANQEIAAHPDHNVIITTHSYLSANGDLSTSKDKTQTNSGQDIWDKLVRKHENIVMVLCGHVTSGNENAINQAKGDHGNTVTQLMINAQSVDHELGGVGIVTMFYFSEDGKTMQVENYSTDRKAFFLKRNQYTLELDLVDNGPAPWVWIAVGGAVVLAIAGAVVLVLLRKKKEGSQD